MNTPSPELVRLGAVFQGGTVVRYHTTPMPIRQNVAEHTFGVIAILFELCYPTQELIRAALHHDIAEKVTGDIPYSAKRRFPALDKASLDAEAEVNTLWQLNTHLTPEERQLLKLADMLELVHFCYCQRKLGVRGPLMTVLENGKIACDQLIAETVSEKARAFATEFLEHISQAQD